MKNQYLLAASVFWLMSIFSGCRPAPPQYLSLSASAASDQRPPAAHESRMTVYRSAEDGRHIIPQTVILPAGEKNPKSALEAMLQADRQQKQSLLPPALSVKSVDVEKGTAYVNFSKELQTLQGGNTAEELLIALTADTLTEFPDIQNVRFFIEGKPVQKLSGRHDMTVPFLRRENMILPEP